MAAVLFFAWSSLQGKRVPRSKTALNRDGRWKQSVAAALVLASPALSGAISDRHMNANAATLALALTPAVVAVAAAAYGSGELAGSLWPGIAGLTGLLLLLPQPTLSSWRLDTALVAMPLISGISAAFVTFGAGASPAGEINATQRADRRIQGGLLLAAAIFGVIALPGLLVGESGVFHPIAAVADGLTFWLLLWTLEHLGAARWSAQVLLTPLVTILEGVVLLRPTLTVRSWLGLLLLLVGGIYLLSDRREDRERDTNLKASIPI